MMDSPVAEASDRNISPAGEDPLEDPLARALADMAAHVRALLHQPARKALPHRERIEQALNRIEDEARHHGPGGDEDAHRAARRESLKALAAIMAAITAHAEGASSPIPALVRPVLHEEAGEGASLAGRIRTLLAAD
ncbi:hypothetical protein [Xanthobacter sp. TB0136]|uniref:hypothetical protein n=1 Tax=Xanthobacter sp. TB0136 TaxID=3459177 RepID=UPI004039E43A